MPELSITQFGSLNTYLNPLSTKDGQIIHCLNLDSNPYGGKIKRAGYSTFLGTPDNSNVDGIFSWTKNDDTTMFLYRVSGSKVYYSAQGTGAWTVCGNGTVGTTNVGYAVLENTLMIGDGVGSTRHTTNGTAFTDTTAAPIASQFVEYQQRIWAMGTSSNIFYSTTGTATDWTTDSSSILIPGEGKLESIMKESDRLVATKTSNAMFKYDGSLLIDMATQLGPDSYQSISDVEDYAFWQNRNGIYIFNGSNPQLISNAIQNQFYNRNDTGIAGSVFDTAPGNVFRYQYMLSVGTITDSFVREQISNAIINYDYQKNEFSNYKYANFPKAYHSYEDTSGIKQLIFGDASGQCYQVSPTATSDNGSAIEANLQIILHANSPFLDKEWGWFEVFTNPGCEAKVQFCLTDTFMSSQKIWKEFEGKPRDLRSGFSQYRFPSGSRGRICFIRIYEASSDGPFSLYGINYTFNLINR